MPVALRLRHKIWLTQILLWLLTKQITSSLHWMTSKKRTLNLWELLGVIPIEKLGELSGTPQRKDEGNQQPSLESGRFNDHPEME